ncbi:glycoside hydrolase family 2 protein [Luteitalea sp.]|jgi:beta-galactosidase/beta-glucuronidase|uniref:glycoside hydrolase family 2 protein n=1 Tax=Luteitalea sp. TaxID=2004800 RepID=UPI0037CC66FD
MQRLRALSLVLALAAVPALAGAQTPAALPRPEFPNPQFERKDWLSLNGPWRFAFDDGDAGLREGWPSTGKKLDRSIVVPFAFESPKSGIGDTRFHPVVWYQRDVAMPAAWKGRRVLLRFGAVDYHATVWLNGQKLGEHEGGSTPFAFDVTDHLRDGGNVVMVRAFDPPTDRFVPRGKQYWKEKSESIFYTRTSGIWQSVWLEAVGDSYLSHVRVTPSMDGAVRFDARLARPAADQVLRATISYNGAVVTRGEAATDGSRAGLGLRVIDHREWQVGQGNLYDVTLELVRGGAVIDSVKTYYGYREVTVDAKGLQFNGRRLYLRMVLDQGYWPESLLTPPSDEAIQYDIKTSQAMGFNGARKHQKVEDPRFLYWADKLGYLVSGEMANAYQYDDQYVARFTREWLEVLERDINHPSIIMWIPINESWGTPNLRDKRQQAHLKANYWLTKSLDPSRLVIENDGWEHVDTTDVFGIHDYARTGDMIAKKYAVLDNPTARIPDNSRAALVPGYEYNGSPIFLSEFGGIAYRAPGSPVPEGAWGYSGVEKTPEDALARLKGLYEAIAKVPRIIGVCYTQLTDVEQEINGLLTYDRKPKFDVNAIKAINDLVRP